MGDYILNSSLLLDDLENHGSIPIWRSVLPSVDPGVNKVDPMKD